MRKRRPTWFLAALLFSGRAGADPTNSPMVVDLHVDVPWQVHFRGRGLDLVRGQASIEALVRGHYGGIVFPIYLPDHVRKTGPNIEDAEGVLQTITRIVSGHSEFLPLGSTHAEPGKISSWMSIEGAGAFAADIPRIDEFVRRGVRLVGLVHSQNNALASSATGTPASYGLSLLGRQLCERIYSDGALVDVSHLSDAGFHDLLSIASQHRAPIVATHSNARRLADHPRNLTDEQIDSIAQSGGVIGLNFHTPFLVRGGPATVADVVRHFDHIVSLAGIDHVAIGSDFDGGIRPAEGLADASALPALANALRAHGVSESDLTKVFALNALRVLGFRNPTTTPVGAARRVGKEKAEILTR